MIRNPVSPCAAVSFYLNNYICLKFGHITGGDGRVSSGNSSGFLESTTDGTAQPHINSS